MVPWFIIVKNSVYMTWPTKEFSNILLKYVISIIEYRYNKVLIPKLDPRVSGYTLSTEMTPIPTNGVRVAVKTEEDCTRNVKMAPANMATYPVNQGQ